ncbi:MAG: hypothetical protein HYZ00_10415, partial [Candidatus Hydrogenedentes bacterium]|nr:hypothetical protein [Candidatus Hydrogenedentota bacterium]
VQRPLELGARFLTGGETPLAFGRLISTNSGALGCDGVIDEVRISKVARDIQGVPAAAFAADVDTVGLWHFDGGGEAGSVPDESGQGNDAWFTRALQRSLDEIDLLSYNPGPSPLDGPAERVVLRPDGMHHPQAQSLEGATQVLSGTWLLAEGGADEERLAGNWPDAIPAEVPGSVHAALLKAGVIPHPRFGKDDHFAREKSFKTWWLQTRFTGDIGRAAQLCFDGVAIRAHVWMNGKKLGSHEGMFGGPVFDISDVVQPENLLIVKIDPAPHTETGIHGNNQAWRQTVVFNNTWGWHYSNIPPLGIWRPVRVEWLPPVQLKDPFIATREAHSGRMDLSVALQGPLESWSGVLQGEIAPHNFEGRAFHFTHRVRSDSALRDVHLQFRIPDPRLWWPVDLGDPNLYTLKLLFTPDGEGESDAYETSFGIRTVEMEPLPGGPYPNKFNWTFVINGRPIFVKGNGWCTMDPLMDFSAARYERFVSLAASQHIQMFRAWGSGMPEADDFYEACDQHGIMVLQEWPTAWNSHLEQPFHMLEETVRLNTLRLRNRPSLVMYGGGNESSNPFGPAIDMMGRLAVELDGTRTFHRGEPWGGSTHNYDCYWGRAPLDRNLALTADFIGEFGLACMPALESVLRYLPEAERGVWPPPADGTVAYHTPIFNTAQDFERLTQYSSYFMSQDSLEHFIIGSQLSQATGVRHALELNRTRWPDCAGVLYYKMNDNFPAASWSCADWYGVPKIGHYIFQDSFAPLLACLRFTSLNTQGQTLSLPVFLLDDAGALDKAEWQVIVRAYDAQLNLLKSQPFDGHGGIERVRELGRFELTPEQNQAAPLLTVAEVFQDGALVQRTFYWTNYEQRPGCLLSLPATQLKLEKQPQRLLITNTGNLPAVGVHLVCPEVSDQFLADDGYFWLDPGETRAVNVNVGDGVGVSAWNAPMCSGENV